MSRIANEKGRLKVVLADGCADVARASNGRFASDPQAIYERWDEFETWVGSSKLVADAPRAVGKDVLSPAPGPRQIVGIGINYRSHLKMAKLQPPESPAVFLRMLTSMTGPNGDVPIYNEFVWTEVELALVLKKTAFRVSEANALDYIAGVTIAQDMIDPTAVALGVQLDGKVVGRYNNGAKSFPGFAPVGPHVVSLDEVGDLGSLNVDCDIDGKPFQRGNTSDMYFSVPELIARLTRTMVFLPGDLILTGTPGRVDGAEGVRLRVGSVITTRVGTIGEQRNHVIDGNIDPGVYL